MGRFDKVLDKLEQGEISAQEALSLIENAKVKAIRGRAHWVNISIKADDFKMPFPIKVPLFLGNFGLWIAKMSNKEVRKELNSIDTRALMKVVKKEMKGVELVDVQSDDAVVQISFS